MTDPALAPFVERAVQRQDWPSATLMQRHRVLPLDLHLDSRALQAMELGVYPRAMEEKWFAWWEESPLEEIQFEESCLHLHRSWSGREVWRLHVKIDARSSRRRARVTEVWCNDEAPDQAADQSDDQSDDPADVPADEGHSSAWTAIDAAEMRLTLLEVIGVLFGVPMPDPGSDLGSVLEHDRALTGEHPSDPLSHWGLLGAAPARVTGHTTYFDRVDPISTRDQRRDYRLSAALLGLAAGDALGAPAEFQSRETNRKRFGKIDHYVEGGQGGWEPGEWTDDTALALCVAEGILERPEDPVDAIGRRFLQWYRARPKDVGDTIGAALRGYPAHGDWAEGSRCTPEALAGRAAGNGSLMRTLPVALAWADREQLLRHSARISAMTHWDPQAEATCAVYCLWVRQLLRGKELDEGLYLALDEVERRVREGDPTVRASTQPGQMQTPGMQDLPEGFFERYRGIARLEESELQPTGYAGYVVHCFEASAWCCLQGGGVRDVLMRAVDLGGETDTIAAVAGGLAGAFHGRVADFGRLHHEEALGGVARALGSLRHRLVYDTPGLPSMSWFEVEKGVYAGRNPLTPEDILRHQFEGPVFKYFLDLREPYEWEADDRFGVEAYTNHDHGLRHLNVPMRDARPPTLEQLDQAVGSLRNLRSVYVHCRAGRERTGAVLVAWLAERDGLSARQALSRLRERGCPIAPLHEQMTAVERWLERRSR